MATIFIEREIGSNSTTETSCRMKVGSHRGARTKRRSVSDEALPGLHVQQEQPVDCGLRSGRVCLPAIGRSSQDHRTSSGNSKQTTASSVSCRPVNMVDQLISNETLSSSCPDLQCEASERSNGRRLTCLPCIVKTGLSTAEQRQDITAKVTNSPSSHPRRRYHHHHHQQQQKPRKQHHHAHTTTSSRSTATETTGKVVEDDQRRSQEAFSVRMMRRSVSDNALPDVRQPNRVDASPSVQRRLPW